MVIENARSNDASKDSARTGDPSAARGPVFPPAMRPDMRDSRDYSPANSQDSEKLRLLVDQLATICVGHAGLSPEGSRLLQLTLLGVDPRSFRVPQSQLAQVYDAASLTLEDPAVTAQVMRGGSLSYDQLEQWRNMLRQRAEVLRVSGGMQAVRDVVDALAQHRVVDDERLDRLTQVFDRAIEAGPSRNPLRMDLRDVAALKTVLADGFHPNQDLLHKTVSSFLRSVVTGAPAEEAKEMAVNLLQRSSHVSPVALASFARLYVSWSDRLTGDDLNLLLGVFAERSQEFAEAAKSRTGTVLGFGPIFKRTGPTLETSSLASLTEDSEKVLRALGAVPIKATAPNEMSPHLISHMGADDWAKAVTDLRDKKVPAPTTTTGYDVRSGMERFFKLCGFEGAALETRPHRYGGGATWSLRYLGAGL
jgi:hypothetical protein